MKKRIFKYKGVKAIVLVFNFLILILSGFVTFDVYVLFKSEGNISIGGYFTVALLGFICLLSCLSLIMVSINSSKSIFTLNILYSSLLLMFLFSSFVQRKDNIEVKAPSLDNLTLAGIALTIALLIVLVNTFRYRERYENIEFIGKHED